jgi:peptidyl-tRNA hydrolase, PTH1 family
MKYIILCLGNKGAEYAETRHNIGFKVADALGKLLDVPFNSCNFGWMADGRYKGRKVMVIKPDTYMNLSGKALKYWANKENVPLQNILVVTDDLHLPFGTLRLKPKGSHAGHNGLRSVEEEMSSNQYPRLRFGISAEFREGQQVDYVLGEWSEAELESLEARIALFAKACLSFCFAGIGNTMTQYNGK